MRKFHNLIGNFNNCFAAGRSVFSSCQNGGFRRTTIQPNMKRLALLRTVNADGLESGAISAVPSQYFAFDGWTGDLDAIEEGSASTPDIVVDTTGPVTLVANFVRDGTPPTVVLVR